MNKCTITVVTSATLLFLGFGSVTYAQRDYKPLLDSFYLSFKDIAAPKNDSSIFSSCKIKPGLGELKVGWFPGNLTTLNWRIPLEQSGQVQKDIEEFIRTKYADTKRYKTASDGTEEEGEIMTSVYDITRPGEKPKLLLQTIYYHSEEEPEQSSFTIMFYGK